MANVLKAANDRDVSAVHFEEEIRSGEVSCYTIPTDAPEADGTFSWNKTTLVVVELRAADKVGFGFSYADTSTGLLAQTLVKEVVQGRNALDVPSLWSALVGTVRNLGREGIAAMAISAIDNAAWDLKAKLLDVPLVSLLGRIRDSMPIYGSGGFTSYSDAQLQAQFEGWKEQGIRIMKMKVGTDPDRDLHRVQVARKTIGDDVALFVDANGAYSRKQALWFAERFAELSVSWFEEPVSSDDLEGLHVIRARAPAGMDIAAGEYGYNDVYFRRILGAEAVDVLQADATRCCGITGLLAAGELCQAAQIPMSSHCAPFLHASPCCCIHRMRHMEYFHDHVRIAHMLFDGVRAPRDGALVPNTTTAGIGLELKRPDAEKFRVS